MLSLVTDGLTSILHAWCDASHLCHCQPECNIAPGMLLTSSCTEKLHQLLSARNQQHLLTFVTHVPFVLLSFQTYKAYTGGVFALTRLLIPAWVVHYYVKYHVAVSLINSTPTIMLSFHSCSDVVVRKTCSWSGRGFWSNQTPPGFFQPPHRPNWLNS